MKLSGKDEKKICKLYSQGISEKQLAKQFKISTSTVSRIIKKHDNQKKLVKKNAIDVITKQELRKVLLGLGITDPNFAISKLSEYFSIKSKNPESTIQIFEVKEWRE